MAEHGVGERYAAWLRGRGEPSAPWNPGGALPPDFISFMGGQPASELFPLEALRDAFGQALVEQGRAILPYGPSQGLPALRDLVARRLAERGIDVDPGQVLITSGSIQGLHLLGRVFLDPGDTILTEAPTFMGALTTWEKEQPRYLTVPVGPNGMDLAAFDATLREAPVRPGLKFVYVLPTFQNPSGVSLDAADRRRLLALADEHDVLLVEDDPYGEIWFDRSAGRLPPIRSLPGAEVRVVYLGSFSKILAPGIRLGFLVASPPLLARLVHAKEGVDFHTDAVVQQAVVNLANGTVEFDLAAHVARARRVYRERRDAMLDALEVDLGSAASWTRPAGGFFLWLDLPPHADAARVAAAARREGVGALPGTVFYPTGGGDHALRLSYANASPEHIREGIRRLARAVKTAR
jgi:2-aminoadipate transaminase